MQRKNKEKQKQKHQLQSSEQQEQEHLTTIPQQEQQEQHHQQQHHNFEYNNNMTSDNTHIFRNVEGITKKKRKSMNKSRPSKDQIQSLFHLRLKDAAEKLDVSTAKLKQVCREYGIMKWPFRQV